ncbi:MAG TPA: OsmC family protein [Polyangiaceae bacterium]
MSEHRARISWKLSGDDFTNGKYSREHTWHFDGGTTIPASASPSVVREPYSNPVNVDPEEAFVAAISSCHMLTFLYYAAREGFKVNRYEDDAVGTMTKNEARVPWVSDVELAPVIEYDPAAQPSPEQERRLHHLAHEHCFIANSVKTNITVRGTTSK